MTKILVDTTVWIDFLRGVNSIQVNLFEKALNDRLDIYICDVIKMEVLQGITGDKEFNAVKSTLNNYLDAPMAPKSYLMAADIYRKARKAGYTIRKSIDCIIAAVAIDNKLELLHNDKDFDSIEKITTLKVYR